MNVCDNKELNFVLRGGGGANELFSSMNNIASVYFI